MQHCLRVTVTQLDAGRAALHGLGAGQAVLHVPSHLQHNRLYSLYTCTLCTHHVSGHVSPGACVQHTGLGAHPVQVYHGVHIGGHTVNGHPLVLAIDGVVQAALLGSHHAQPRAHAQAVQVTAVSVPREKLCQL